MVFFQRTYLYKYNIAADSVKSHLSVFVTKNLKLLIYAYFYHTLKYNTYSTQKIREGGVP